MALAAEERVREVRLKDLAVGDSDGIILVRVLSAERKEIRRRSDGGRRIVLAGLVSDGTATVRFTWWDPPNEGVERGTVFRAARFRIGEFGGRPEISFDGRTQFGEASAVELPALPGAEHPLRSVRELAPGDEGFRLRVRVLSVGPKTVLVDRASKEIYEGQLADRSGVIGFTAWSDFRLRAEEVVELGNVRVRSFRGANQLAIDARSTVERIEQRALPPTHELAPWHRLRLHEIGGGASTERIEVRGVVIGLSPPSGIVYRCPDCGRSMNQGACRLHGVREGVPDLRARLVIDDGSRSVTVNLSRIDTERLSTRTLDGLLADQRSRPDPAAAEEALFDALFGRTLVVRGRASSDTFGVTVWPEGVEEETPDLGPLVEALTARLSERAR